MSKGVLKMDSWHIMPCICVLDQLKNKAKKIWVFIRFRKRKEKKNQTGKTVVAILGIVVHSEFFMRVQGEFFLGKNFSTK